MPTRADANTLAIISPMIGTPFPDTILNMDGNSLSLAAAIGNCPWSRIHPFRAPKQDIAAPAQAEEAGHN